jgi:hypothetical protein
MELYQSSVMSGKREQWQELTLKHITSIAFSEFEKSKRQEPAGISPLLNKDGFLHSDSQFKAEILNNQFQSVYTKEDTTQYGLFSLIQAE